jgi:uncharacterized NAD(P)/FAD-binding protein YdhS
MSSARPSVFAIVGGGASGVILAAHLLSVENPDIRVILIEKRDQFGEGIAYSTTLPDHVLNVSAFGMSALADQPEHFRNWLIANGHADGASDPIYAERRLYGTYLNDLLDELITREGKRGRLTLVSDSCLALRPGPSGVALELSNGTSIAAHVAILATGHDEQPRPQQPLAVRPGTASDTDLDPNASIVILGTGLSMVDTWLALRGRGHRGRIQALSRRGLTPQTHQASRPIKLDQGDIPLGTELSYFFGWLRAVLSEARQRGLGWRDVIDGLRPFNQAIWQSWPVSAKRRFLEHTKPWWDVHRHRLAPQIHRRMEMAIDAGDLEIIAGRVSKVEDMSGSLRLTYRDRKTGQLSAIDADRVYDCTGIVRDVGESTNVVIRDIVEKGIGRPDGLRLGLDVTSECEVVDAAGNPSDRLFAVGPLTRGTFFEIEAVPDIRVQCDKLARRLVNSAEQEA